MSKSSNCGEGIQKRHRVCLNPSTRNDVECDGQSEQTTTCYKPCESGNGLPLDENKFVGQTLQHKFHQKPNGVAINSKKNLAYQNKAPTLSLLTSKTIKYVYSWSSWSSWSMICDADCRRSRVRECQISYYSTEGKLIQLGDSHGIEPKCPGPDIEYDNCTFYCERVTSKNLKN